MGLFSSNRINSLSPVMRENAVNGPTDDSKENENKTPEGEVVKEPTVEAAAPADSDEMNDEAPTIDDDVAAMVDDEYEESALASVELDDQFNSIVESCININEMDSDILSKLVELDFVTICREHTLGLEEAVAMTNKDNVKKISNLRTDVDKVFVGMESSVSQLAKRTVDSMKELFESDNAVKKFANVMTEENLEGFGEGVISFPSKESGHNLDKAANLRSLQKIMVKGFNDISEANTRDEVNIASHAVKEALEAEGDVFMNCIAEAMKPNTEWKPNATDIGLMEEFISSNISTKAIENGYNSIMTDMKIAHEYAMKAVDSCNEDTELDVYKANRIYNLASSFNKIAGKKYQVFNDLVVREMADIRKAVLVCGPYASKKAAGKDTSIDEAVLSMVCDASDTYIFDKFDR